MDNFPGTRLSALAVAAGGIALAVAVLIVGAMVLQTAGFGVGDATASDRPVPAPAFGLDAVAAVFTSSIRLVVEFVGLVAAVWGIRNLGDVPKRDQTPDRVPAGTTNAVAATERLTSQLNAKAVVVLASGAFLTVVPMFAPCGC